MPREIDQRRVEDRRIGEAGLPDGVLHRHIGLAVEGLQHHRQPGVPGLPDPVVDHLHHGDLVRRGLVAGHILDRLGLVLCPGPHRRRVGKNIDPELLGGLGGIGLEFRLHLVFPANGHAPARHEGHHPAVDFNRVKPGLVPRESRFPHAGAILDMVQIVVRMEEGMVGGQPLDGLLWKNQAQLPDRGPVKRGRSQAGVVHHHAAPQHVFTELLALLRGVGEVVMTRTVQDGVLGRIRADLLQRRDLRIVVDANHPLHAFQEVVDVVRRGIPLVILVLGGISRQGRQQANHPGKDPPGPGFSCLHPLTHRCSPSRHSSWFK